MELAAPGAELLGMESGFAQAVGPIGDQGAVDGAGRRILIDADGGWKEAMDVVNISLAGSGHDGASEAHFDLREGADIRAERAYLVGGVEDNQMVPGLHHVRVFKTQGREEFTKG